MFTKLLCTCTVTHWPLYYQHFITIIYHLILWHFLHKNFLFIFSDCKKSSYIWKFEEGVKIHPDQAFSANPKNISKDNFLDYIQMLTPRWPYVYMYLHLISAIFILNAHEQFVLFLCNTIHEMLLRMLFMCFWLTLYINVYDLYKHLVVNQLVFTCYLLQNSNTWEMSLKYGIFF